MLNNYFVCGAKVLKRDLQVVELNYSGVVNKVKACLRSNYLGSLSEIRVFKGCKPVTNFSTLEQCYASCSGRKWSVYGQCNQCAREIDSNLNVYCSCGVSSYNANIFTYGICFTINNVIYYLYITPSKNALYIYPQD